MIVDEMSLFTCMLVLLARIEASTEKCVDGYCYTVSNIIILINPLVSGIITWSDKFEQKSSITTTFEKHLKENC